MRGTTNDLQTQELLGKHSQAGTPATPRFMGFGNAAVFLVTVYCYNNGLCTACMLLYGKRQSEKSPPEKKKKTPQQN